MLDIEHLLIEEEVGERKVEIKTIKILEDAFKEISDESVKSKIKNLLMLLKEKESILIEIIKLDDALVKKKYNQTAVSRLTPEIRKMIEKLVKILQTHESIVNQLLGKITKEEINIKKIIKTIYGRVVSKKRARFMKNNSRLLESDELVPCFILTSKIEDFLADLKKMTSKYEFIKMFKSIGTQAIQELILFKISPSQDLSILKKCPPPQPQRVEGLIEQKFPGKIKINILTTYNL